MMDEKYLMNVAEIMKDVCVNRSRKFSAENVFNAANEAVRDQLTTLLGSDKLTYQSLRNNKNQIYTILEDVLANVLPEAWKADAFYRRFVEVRNGRLGEKNAFSIKDKSNLVVSRFSGGTWDVDRQKLGRAKTIAIDTEWIYVSCYDELDRFLAGYTTIPEMMAEIQEAFARDVDSRIALIFNGMGTYLPSEFKHSGVYDREQMLTMISKVRTYNKSKVVLAGSQTALAKISTGLGAFATDSAKEEFCTTGMILRNTGLGVDALVIPDSFIEGTYKSALDDDVIYILPDTKMIKIFYEGDVRAKEYDDNESHDQTMGLTFQQRLGVGLVTSQIFAKYTLA